MPEVTTTDNIDLECSHSLDINTAIRENMFVFSNSKYGIGKVLNIDENNFADVLFFIGINNEVREKIDISKLKHIYLGFQTRIYSYSNEHDWRTGRVVDYEIMDDNSIEYEIKFSGGKQPEWLREKDIYVRCLTKLGDPTDVLAYSYGESQFLHDGRYKILNWMTDLRASVKGLEALSSSSIDLVVHQVNIAKKILSDPLQRYLLSDEVGMGKTIEAGIIARQCLLDSYDSTVLIIVPKHLLLKWEKELFSKFYLDDFQDRINITSIETLDDNIKKPTLLIVDEAHHIVGDTNKYSLSEKEFIIELSKKSEKLLMLTATPGVGNERILFNLLQILEPSTYKEESFDIFKEKLLKQRDQGSFLRTLNSTTSLFLLKRNLSKVSILFPNDNICLNIANNILERIENKENFVDQVLELKTYIIETWNFHNRLIRTRRVDCESWEFQDRGNIVDNKCSQEDIQLLTNPNNVYEDINYQIENWRSEVSLLLENLPITIQKLLEKRYIKLLEKSNGTIVSFKEFLEDIKQDLLFKDELPLLESIQNVIDDYNNIECHTALCNQILDFLNKIDTSSIGVLFVDNIKLARVLNSIIVNLIGEDQVFILNDIVESSCEYRSEYPKLRVIIIDKNNEEGVDLQFADAIIHYDLLFDVSRVEQRIGRLDRYGRTKSNKIQHLIVLPTDNEDYPWVNWFELLLDGFKVFNKPISDIQLKLEDINNSIYSELLKYGTSALISHFENGDIVSSKTDNINNIILMERKYLDEQYALNHLSLSDSDSLNLRNIIEEGEYEEGSIEKDINYWLFNVLKFFKWKIDDKRFKIEWSKKTLVPQQQFWSKDNKFISDMWFKKFELSLDRELTYYRNTSNLNKKTSLIRPGHPLFIALKDYLDMEDRGTTFSTFRVVEKDFPKHIPRGSIEIVFKLVYLMDIDFTAMNSEFNNNALSRRCDEYFPPKIFTLYIDEKMNIIDDADIIETLNEPYVKDKYIDTNLSSRGEIIEYFIEKKSYLDLCRKVSLNAKSILFRSDMYKNYILDSTEKSDYDIRKRLFKLEQRNQISKNQNNDDLIKFEKTISKLISQYEIKLDSFGMFFLSKYPIDELGLNIE
ncbi:MAG: hypothetical protein CL624_04500 [Arcobacter sp.]|nr:hypothetical protein [Arcobacter sp.]|tara:strand:- start:7766 stop:11050 length:3285 start_codon:yes stop_codon:yes gene_type:complete